MVADQTFRVRPDIVLRARPDVGGQRSDYYAERYREMQDASAAPDEATAKRLVSELSNLGYLWQTPASTLREPGTPSLVDYMRTASPAQARRRVVYPFEIPSA